MITYKGIDYPTRDLSIIIYGNRRDITIAQESLSVVFNGVDWNKEISAIDDSIYFYVEDKYWDLSDEEIAKNHLDEPFEMAPDEDD